MAKKRTKAANLGEAAIVERAKSLATQWMWAVALQHARITKPRSQDSSFHPFGLRTFNEADVHFLAIALRRIRTVATTLEHVPKEWNSVNQAIQTFDNRLPWLKPVRDVYEHLEDYAVDSNLRRTGTTRRELQVWTSDEEGLNLLGYYVNWNEALAAAKDLYAAVKSVADSYFQERDK